MGSTEEQTAGRDARRWRMPNFASWGQAVAIVAIAFAVLLVAASAVPAAISVRTQSVGSAQLHVLGSMSSYDSQFCLVSSPTHTTTAYYDGLKWVTDIVPTQTGNSSGPCTIAHYGEVWSIYNNTTGALLDKILLVLQQPNASAQYIWWAPVVGTAISAEQEIEFWNVSGTYSEWQCNPAGHCSPPAAPSGGSGGGSPAACSYSGYFSSGPNGNAIWLNQCVWQQIAQDLCSPISDVGWALFILIGAIVGFFTDGIGAFVALLIALGCAYVSWLAGSSNGASLIDAYIQQCWSGWGWSWCWVVANVYYANRGPPPPGF